MSEEIKEKNEINEAEKADETAADAVKAEAGAAEPAENEADMLPAGPEVPETRLEWRDTLGLQLSDVEDYMVNAGVNGGSSEHTDDHEDLGAGDTEKRASADVPASAAVSAAFLWDCSPCFWKT